MRTIYVCLSCAAQYLPPEAMHYPKQGVDASPVHCGLDECRSSVEATLDTVGIPAETMALWARRAAGLAGEPRRGRPGRLARGRRASASPGSGRSKFC